MSLYNHLFNENEDSIPLLGMIDCTKEMFGRFRDVFICDKGENIIVYTRTGGPNREDYLYEIDCIRNNPNYIKDYDDDFDNTYMYFKFKVPEKYIETARKLYKEEPLTIKEKFDKEMKEMDDPNSEAYKKAQDITQLIMSALEDGQDKNEIKHINL